MSGEVDYQKEPGRVVVKPLADDQWYWHAYIGDVRVNGGMVDQYAEGMSEGQRAIAIFRKQDWMKNYIFDFESGKWYRRGEDPPSVM